MQSDLLKKDLFGEVRLEFLQDRNTIVRDIATAAWPLRWLARLLMRREARILAALDGIDGVPQLIALERDRLRRSYLAGAPLQRARPSEPQFFRAAMQTLRQLHRAGVVHNDLAKEPNVLVRDDGSPAFIDFQLAGTTRRRGKLFRTLAYDDVRHLLKHKRTYCPDALTAREHRILQRKSAAARIWMRTGKPVYLFVTRRLLGWADREGAGDRGARA